MAAIAKTDLLSSIIAFLLALLIGAVIIALMGVNPIKAYAALLDGAVGNRNSLAETLLRAVPLSLAGVGVAISFRAGVFNIGAEGQLFVGAMAAAWVGLEFPDLPSALLILLMALAGMLAGGLWAGIAGLLKAWMNASEMINTIMLNYIAIYLIGYLVHGPLQDPKSPLGQTARLPRSAYLPILMHGTRLHIGLIITIVAAILIYILLWRTSWGFQIRVVGKNLLAAKAAGMKVNRVMVSALVLSGMLAGLAGFCEAAGVQHRMIENISPGYGYTAIVVALLGQINPLGVLVSGVLFAALQVGASTMESAVGVPSSVITVIQYTVVLLLIGRGAFDMIRSRIRASKQTREEA
jgi:simple sugar transport system permease protein